MEFFQTFGIMTAVALIPLVLYALTSAGRDFDLISWILYSKNRLVLMILLILLFSVLITFVPEAEAVLVAVGFNPDKSSAALGLAVGGLVVSGIRGNQEK